MGYSEKSVKRYYGKLGQKDRNLISQDMKQIIPEVEKERAKKKKEMEQRAREAKENFTIISKKFNKTETQKELVKPGFN